MFEKPGADGEGDLPQRRAGRTPEPDYGLTGTPPLTPYRAPLAPHLSIGLDEPAALPDGCAW